MGDVCPDDGELVLLLEGRLDLVRRERVEHHLDSCATCRRVVGVAGRSAGLTSSDPASALPAHSLRGATFSKYVVLDRIGRGAMGAIYAAYDPDLDRRVALKVLHTAGATERVLREARALGKLSHPNVVQVYEVGEHDGDVFIAMELVDGASLDVWCRSEPAPNWREVLRTYLDAARGLAAAHDKGLVHRDVKPANLLRGKDGRVRVADFGLAASDEPPSADVSAPRTIVGTPLYMAPEQLEGLRATALSDQYGLCASLYEGLYGAPPLGLHRGLSLDELLERKRANVSVAPPSGSPVPERVRQAIFRGLSPAPTERWPSIDALVVALSDDPARRRRSLAWTGGLIGVAVVAATAWAEMRQQPAADPCEHPEGQLAGSWDDGIKARVRAAFLATGRPYAEDTATRVIARLDTYAASWSTMRGEVCVDARTAVQRHDIDVLRDVCLDRRRAQLGALTKLFAEKSDPDVLDKSIGAALNLSPIEYCADTAALTARLHPPEDPALRAHVAELQPRIDRLEAQYTAGQYKAGLADADAVVRDARAVGYAPMQAQAIRWSGELADGAGDYERAAEAFRTAAVSAAEGDDDLLAAYTWSRFLFILGERQRRFPEAAPVRSFGAILVARAHDLRTEAAWRNAEGLLLYRMGQYEDARTALDKSIQLTEKVQGPDSPDLATKLSNLSLVLMELDADVDAKAALERAVALRERVFGPDHPVVGAALINLGRVLARLGDPAALGTYERAATLEEHALGPDHPYVALALNNLSGQLAAKGELTRGRAAAERALSIREKTLGRDHPDVAQSLYTLGEVLRQLGDLDGSAAAMQRSLDILEKALGPEHTDLEHPLAGLARSLLRLGRLDEASRLLDRAVALHDKTASGRRSGEVEALFGQGELFLARKQPDKALPWMERARAEQNAVIDPEVKLGLAEALWGVGKDRPRARRLVEEARATYDTLGNRDEQARCARWLADHPP